MTKLEQFKKEHADLLKAGKHFEAGLKLRLIWALEASGEVAEQPKVEEAKIEEVEEVTEEVIEEVVKAIEEVAEKPVVEVKAEKPKSKTQKKSDLDSLSKIKGIGSETVEDIKSIFPDLDTLKSALMEGKRLPLRNDVEKKLRTALIN